MLEFFFVCLKTFVIKFWEKKHCSRHLKLQFKYCVSRWWQSFEDQVAHLFMPLLIQYLEFHILFTKVVVVVQSLSCVRLFATPWAVAHPSLQHLLPCPSLSPGVCADSCPLSWWCHPAISFFVFPFSHLQYFPVSESFPVASGGQSIGASASASALPVNIWGWFPLGSTGLISLLSQRLSRMFSSPTVWRHQVFVAQPFFLSSFHIPTWLLEKP